MPGSLSTYRAKRDFKKTAEPSGEIAVAPSERRRFVIQKHAATRLHYDFRLELDGVFKSWAVTRGPSLDPREKRLAVEVEDHPLDYGDFEGTIPKGEYGGGTVQLWDRGYWAPDGEESPDAAIKDGTLKFKLDGERLHGSWVLVRMKHDRSGSKRNNWLLIKHRDEFARDNDSDALLSDDRSIASGRKFADIASGKGRKPKSFILKAKKAAAPDAVWNSKEKKKSKNNPDATVVMGVEITKPEKALWPDAGDRKPVSKLDLARYYETVGPWMIAHLERAGRARLFVRPTELADSIFFSAMRCRERRAGSR